MMFPIHKFLNIWRFDRQFNLFILLNKLWIYILINLLCQSHKNGIYVFL